MNNRFEGGHNLETNSKVEIYIEKSEQGEPCAKMRITGNEMGEVFTSRRALGQMANQLLSAEVITPEEYQQLTQTIERLEELPQE